MDFPILHNPLSQPPMSMQSTPPLVFPALSESTTEEEEGEEEGEEEEDEEEEEEEEGLHLNSIIEEIAKNSFMRETTKHINGLQQMAGVDDPRNIWRVRLSPFIFRLRRSLEITNCLFKPRVISIGPYHHGKNCLAKMERHKSRFLQDFLSRDASRSLEHHQNKVKMMEQMIRDDYKTKFDLTSDQFVDMMILDGCFILELLIKIYNHTPDEIFKNESLLPYIKTDLLMIENQVPFLVLEILYGDPRNYGGPIPTINQLLAYYFWGMKDDLWRYEGPSHHSLLHSYHQLFIFPPLGDKKAILAQPKRRKSTKFCVVHRFSDIPSAQELEKAGVVFKAKKAVDFLDITFHGKVLEMSVLSVDEPFLLLLINLVMFEVFGRVDIMNNYCYFMSSLLQYPDDVVVLRKHGIIESNLMTDVSLTNLFFQLQSFRSNPPINPVYFLGLIEDLRQFCDRSETTWQDILGYYAYRMWSIIEFLWFSFWAVLYFLSPIIGLGVVIMCIVVLIKT